MGSTSGAPPPDPTALVREVTDARRVPGSVERVLRITNGEPYDPEAAALALRDDPILAARLLGLVGSAATGLRGEHWSLEHAVNLVGRVGLRQLVTTAFALNLYRARDPRAVAIVEHAAAVAALCRYLAVWYGLPPEELVSIGHLHDSGRQMLLEHRQREYRELLKRVHDSGDELARAERQQFGVDHGALAAQAFAAWGLPERLCEVVRLHHDADARADDPDTQTALDILRVASALVRSVERKDSADARDEIVAMVEAQRLEIGRRQLEVAWPELRTVVRCARRPQGTEAAPIEDAEAALVHPSMPPRDSLASPPRREASYAPPSVWRSVAATAAVAFVAGLTLTMIAIGRRELAMAGVILALATAILVARRRPAERARRTPTPTPAAPTVSARPPAPKGA
ncbi:MAG: HDOD domain-containing protein [Polyangiaceae bacterium]|nr:HDOD domain-containing protein [Polyangiaceae bacterium]